MKPIILITGANGAVAQRFSSLYAEQFQFRFLTRNPIDACEYKWDVNSQYIDDKALEGVDHIIHLAGANIAGSRWTTARKKELRDSRILTGQMISDVLERKGTTIKSFITASAVGYYGSITSQKIFKETDTPAEDYVSRLCQDWEKIADNMVQRGLAERSCKLRLGLVLDAHSGVLRKVTPIVKMGLGSALGTGKQYMPWIHIDDLSGILYLSLTSDMNGTYNTIAPDHATNGEFMEAIASILKKPYFIPKVPSNILRLLFGEMSVVVLEGSRASAEKIQKQNFHFEYPTLDDALKDILT